MAINGAPVRPSLRQVLADSHVAAVAIFVLLLWSLDCGFRALWQPLYRLGSFVVFAIAILGIPESSAGSAFLNRLLLLTTLSSLSYALIYLAAAELLSRWVYGVGPLRILRTYRDRLTRSDHA